MNHRKTFYVVVFISLLAVCSFSCKKEILYKAIIKVSMQYSDGSIIPVPACKLVFGDDNYSEKVKRTVYTDEAGQYEGTWDREVNLRVVASKEINGKLYTGGSVVSLKAEGKTEQEIFIQE
ncbi:MAG: hypothetical protein LBQ64_00855 [Bacteroidales bacterium]|jgi:hypothetical protein|nr:hypothetical protein [Bacteroidales bacterium]